MRLPLIRKRAVSSCPPRFPFPEIALPSPQVFAFTLGALALADSPGGRITLLPAPPIPTLGR
jgi:hypothetical protein